MDSGSQGYFIKTDAWDARLTNFSLATVHSPSARTTRITLHLLLKAELQYLLRRLRSLEHLVGNPLLVPLILMESGTEHIQGDLEHIRTSLYYTEKMMGTHKNYRENVLHRQHGYYARGKMVWNQSEFDAAPGRLNSMVSECVMIETMCTINEQLLGWLETLNDQLSHGIPGIEQPKRTDPKKSLNNESLVV